MIDEFTNLKKRMGDIEKLPTLSEVAALVLKLINAPDSTADEVANVITRDASLSSMVLKTVNSAYFGLRYKVAEINQGITLLGFKRLKNIVIALLMADTFKAEKRYKQDILKFWRHSAVTAGISRRISLKLGRLDFETSYLIGLLHDVGKLILMTFFNETYDKVVRLAKTKSISFYEAEKEILPRTHPELANDLFVGWRFSEEICNSVLFHHNTEKFFELPHTSVLYIANYISWVKGIRCEGNFELQTFDVNVFNKIGLMQDDLDELINYADMESEVADIILNVAGS